MVWCRRCKIPMYDQVVTGRVEDGSCRSGRITGFTCRICGNWIDLFIPPQPVVVEVEPVIEVAPVVLVEPVVIEDPVVVAEDYTAGVYALAVAYFDNIASMLRHKAGWQTIARLIQHACGTPVDEALLQHGYDAEKERRVDLRRKNRVRPGKAVMA